MSDSNIEGHDSSGETGNYTYIIASIGRCSSSYITQEIENATGKSASYSLFLKDTQDRYILKTHCHFTHEFPYAYKAIFLYSDISSVIASLFFLQGKPPDFLQRHLKHLDVSMKHRKCFLYLDSRGYKTAAYLYLIIGDKFRFEKNFKSWKRSKHTLFVDYNLLCENTEVELKRISNFLGFEFPNFKIKKRNSSAEKLPWILRQFIRWQYKALKP